MSIIDFFSWRKGGMPSGSNREHTFTAEADTSAAPSSDVEILAPEIGELLGQTHALYGMFSKPDWAMVCQLEVRVNKPIERSHFMDWLYGPPDSQSPLSHRSAIRFRSSADYRKRFYGGSNRDPEADWATIQSLASKRVY